MVPNPAHHYPAESMRGITQAVRRLRNGRMKWNPSRYGLKSEHSQTEFLRINSCRVNAGYWTHCLWYKPRFQPKQKELDHLLALLTETEKEAESIARATPKAKGIITKKLEQQADEVNKRYQTLTTRQMKLQEALAVELTDQNIDSLLDFREAVAVGLESPTFEDKRRWLEILQVKVTVTNGIAVITCRLDGNLEYNLFELRLSHWQE